MLRYRSAKSGYKRTDKPRAQQRDRRKAAWQRCAEMEAARSRQWKGKPTAWWQSSLVVRELTQEDAIPRRGFHRPSILRLERREAYVEMRQECIKNEEREPERCATRSSRERCRSRAQKTSRCALMESVPPPPVAFLRATRRDVIFTRQRRRQRSKRRARRSDIERSAWRFMRGAARRRSVFTLPSVRGGGWREVPRFSFHFSLFSSFSRRRPRARCAYRYHFLPMPPPLVTTSAHGRPRREAPFSSSMMPFICSRHARSRAAAAIFFDASSRLA